MPDENRNHDHDETMQRINQANRAAGGLVLMPEQWAETVAQGDELNRSMFEELPHDHDPVAQRMAGHMVKDHINAWDAAGRRSVNHSFCPEAEATLYVMDYAGNPAFITGLRNMQQLEEVKDDLLASGGLFRCSAPVNRHCALRVGGMNAEYPVELLAVKRGEYICVFITCPACLQHITSGAGFNDDYIGPDHDWVDDREAHPRPQKRR